ncbi:hypothetical protein MASR1M49_30860 [Pararhodobacter aggregans]
MAGVEWVVGLGGVGRLSVVSLGERRCPGSSGAICASDETNLAARPGSDKITAPWGDNRGCVIR